MVRKDRRTTRRVRPSKAPPAGVHKSVALERVVALLLKSTRKDGVALLIRRSEGRVVRVEGEDGVDGGVEVGVVGDDGGGDFFSRVDSAPSEGRAFVHVG